MYVEIGHDTRDRSGGRRHDDGGSDGKGFKGVERCVEMVMFARRYGCVFDGGGSSMDRYWVASTFSSRRRRRRRR